MKKKNSKDYKVERMSISAEDKDGVLMPQIENFLYPVKGVKRYYHTLFRLLNLNGCERALLDWLTEVMRDDNNSIYMNNDEVDRFIETVRGSVKYKPSTVWQAFKKLRARNLVLKTKKARGLFHVNPVFFSKGSEKDRVKTIKMLLEFNVSDSDETNSFRLSVFKDINLMKK